jgi:Nucleoside-diphosphate-sugar epimerases
MDNRTFFILGGSGFIGHAAVVAAINAGWQVKTIVRSAEKADMLRRIGAQPILGDVTQPQEWIREAQGASVLIDLVQPKLPKRLTRGAILAVSAERQAITGKVIDALRSLPAEERPILFSISGADDLQPDAKRRISHMSPLRARLYGFSNIGVPVRRLIEESGLDATYVYLGNIVYGPGKIFADLYVNGLAKGSANVIGSGTNRLPLVHVTDAARALVHLAGLPRTALVQKTFIAMDGTATTQRQLLDDTAALMGIKRARTVPGWLAALIAGQIAMETVTLDVQADPSALLATGFQFTYPSHRAGLPATLTDMGYTPKTLVM